jgi:hypothetical protein
MQEAQQQGRLQRLRGDDHRRHQPDRVDAAGFSYMRVPSGSPKMEATPESACISPTPPPLSPLTAFTAGPI